MGPKGILIVFSMKQRQVRIETGSEIWGRLTDEEAKSIIDEIMVPEFKKENYFKGLLKGITAIGTELKS